MKSDQGESILYPWHKADWSKFSKELAKVDMHMPEIISCKKLAKLVSHLYKHINQALDSACPKRKVSKPKLNHDWYTDELNELHEEVQKAFRKVKKTINREKLLTIIRTLRINTRDFVEQPGKLMEAA